MTPLEIEEAARNKYNSIGDNFYSSEEIMHLIYEACSILAQETLCIERVFTTTTVASQQEYGYPTNAISIKRVTYDGNKLKPINMREDDSLTLLNAQTTATGVSQYYYIWNEVLYLRPIPSDALQLKIFAYCEPQTVTSASTLEVPTMFHKDIVNYVVGELCDKDENDRFAQKYYAKWEKGVEAAKRWARKKRRGDALAVVQDEESLSETILGST